MTTKKKMGRFLVIVIVLIAASITIVTLYDNVIANIKLSQTNGIKQVKERNFEMVWDHLEYLSDLANSQATEVAVNIEKDIKEQFDLSQLEQSLNTNDEVQLKKLHQVLRDNIDGVYLAGVKNNRNSIIVLQGYDTILEDLFIGPESYKTDSGYSLSNPPTLSKYMDNTYNKYLLQNAINKISTHSDQPIAIEPYNCSGENHEQLTEMNYDNLKRIYMNEGIRGIKGYQFLVPVYITDTGDIFGKKDTVNGVPQKNNKFVIIQTFNLHDHLIRIKPEFDEKEEITDVIQRYDRILNSLYIFGIILCSTLVIIILYFFSLYNAIIDAEDNEEDSDQEEKSDEY